MAKKKSNIFRRYFENFGLKQICDILMIVSLVVLIVGWCICRTTEVVLQVAFGLFILTSLLGIIRCFGVIHREPNKRSPERRAAIVSMVIMLVILAIAIFALIWSFAVGFVLPRVN